MAPTVTVVGPSNSETNLPPKKLISIFTHIRVEPLIAGVTGGVVSTLILHPIDLVKVRFQEIANKNSKCTNRFLNYLFNDTKPLYIVNEESKLFARKGGQTSLPRGLEEVKEVAKRPRYRGVLDALFTIGRTEGARGLYQGVTASVTGAGASWGLYFLFYNAIKKYMLADKDTSHVLNAGQHMLAAAESGVLTLAITNPIWVTKTKLCLQYDRYAAQKISPSRVMYRGMFHCMSSVYRTEGIRGLYKGFLPGMFGVSHGAFQFMAYEELKTLYNRYKEAPPNSKFSSAEYLCFAAISKTFAASATYPYQVVRTRLQDQHRQYSGVIDVIKQTWSKEGLIGFYKGLTPSLLRVTPACCITFVVYENMIEYLNKKQYFSTR